MKQELANRLLCVLKEYKALRIAEQIDFQKFYLYSIIANSTAIEGSTVTEIEAQLLFDEGITSGKRTLAEQMMNLERNFMEPFREFMFEEHVKNLKKEIEAFKKSQDFDLMALGH